MNLFIIFFVAAVVLLLTPALLWWSRRKRTAPATDHAGRVLGPQGVSWSGWRRFRVRKRVDEDSQGRFVSFYLCPENRRRLPTFEPGQHVQLRVEVPDAMQPDRMNDWIRPFYLSDSSNGRYYRICVQRLDTGAGGQISTWLIGNLRKGGLVELQAPEGACPFPLESQAPLVLIAMGAGIAPVLAVCNTLIDRKSTRDVSILYGMRNESDLIHLPNLDYAASHLTGAKVQLCFSETMPGGTVDGATTGDGVVYRRGNIGTAFLKKSITLTAPIYYLCGPDPALDTLASDLDALGVPADQIHRAGFAE